MSSDKGNLCVYRPRQHRNGVAPGHQVKIWETFDGDGNPVAGKSKLVTVVGETIGKRYSPGFETIEVDDPQVKIEVRGTHAIEGTYYTAPGSKKPVLQPIAQDDNYWYCLMATGLILSEVDAINPKTGRMGKVLSTEPDLLGLRRHGVQATPHGFHSLGGARSVFAAEAGIDFAGEESKRLWSSVGRDRIRGVNDTPQYRYDLVAVPKSGGEGLMQDVDGTFVRVVGTPQELKTFGEQDPKYRKFWDLAEDKRTEENAARREARRLAKQG